MCCRLLKAEPSETSIVESDLIPESSGEEIQEQSTLTLTDGLKIPWGP